jgi:hypothetical protein
MLNVRDLAINVLPGEGLRTPVYPQYLDTAWRPYDDDDNQGSKGGKKGSSKGSTKGSKKASKAPSKKGSKKK